jgi:hypothetical protein
LTPFSERRLRKRLENSVSFLENQQLLFFSFFLNLAGDKVISADK